MHDMILTTVAKSANGQCVLFLCVYLQNKLIQVQSHFPHDTLRLSEPMDILHVCEGTWEMVYVILCDWCLYCVMRRCLLPRSTSLCPAVLDLCVVESLTIVMVVLL